MADRAEIKCINKRVHADPHERITHVGGMVNDRWKLSSAEAINYIETNRWEFYVTRGGRTVDVIVATRNGRKYLKTVNDGVSPDNLLSLPECP